MNCNQNVITQVIVALKRKYKSKGHLVLADLCGVSYQTVKRWETLGRLPSSDYTGETNYSDLIAEATGGDFTQHKLLRRLHPIITDKQKQKIIAKQMKDFKKRQLRILINKGHLAQESI